jgi:hypothetical protein
MFRGSAAHPALAADAPPELRELGLESIDVAGLPLGNLAEQRDAAAVQEPRQLRSDAVDQLQIVGLYRVRPERR